jgi:hemoglobin
VTMLSTLSAITPLRHRWPAPAFAASLVLAIPLHMNGCGARNDSSVSSSGDPEADQRAEQRVGSDESSTPESRTLYDRLGGRDRIVAIVDDFTQRSIEDPRVNFDRSNVRTNWLGKKYSPWQPTPEHVDLLKQRMVEFLSLAAGGPAEYTGRDIGAIHEGMKITNNEFDAMVGDIKASMDKLGVAAKEKRDLLAIVETTRKQIVENP